MARPVVIAVSPTLVAAAGDSLPGISEPGAQAPGHPLAGRGEQLLPGSGGRQRVPVATKGQQMLLTITATLSQQSLATLAATFFQ